METATDPVPPPLTENERIHRYGYREIPRTLPDGQVVFDRVGLTLEHLLHPRMGDKAVESSLHDLERGYLAWVFRARVADAPQAHVLSDTGVFWDDPNLGHHCPDVVAIFGLRQRRANWTVSSGARAALFHRRSKSARRSATHQSLSLDAREVPETHAQRRRPLLFTATWHLDRIGIEGDTVACYDGKTGARLGDYVEVSESLDEAQKVAESEAKRADDEYRLRQLLEAEIQALHEQIKRPHPNGE